jgi:chorismate mutase/prephenate dehydratase
MSAPEADSDPFVRELREQIAATDSSLVETVNKRVELVRRLKEHKATQGYDFVDRSQEERLLERLAAGNRGPLSEDGLRELYRALLELTKREA